MEQQLPFNLSQKAFQEPTNDLIQPTDIDPLEEVTPEVVPANHPKPQLHRDEIDLIMAQADDVQMFRDFEEYMYNGYDSDTDTPEDSDAEYADSD